MVGVKCTRKKASTLLRKAGLFHFTRTHLLSLSSSKLSIADFLAVSLALSAFKTQRQSFMDQA
jgi:hypothetical protein